MTIRSAIILAAGRGSRLGAHSARRAKCLARLGGRSLLDWQIDALHAAGVDDIALVAGYRADALRKRKDLRVIVNATWERTGPIASLLCADPATYASGFFLVYGDGVFHPEWIDALDGIPQAIGITSDTRWQQLWSERFARVLDDAERLRCQAGRLTEIGGRAQSVDEIEGQFTGLVKFAPRGWAATQAWLDAQGSNALASLDTTALLGGLVDSGIAIGVAQIAGRWCEVDSAADLALYRRALRRRQWSHDWRWQDRPWA